MFYSGKCVFYRTISLPSFNEWSVLQIGEDLFMSLYTYLMYYWVECMTSVISFAYFTHFSSLNISGTNAGIYKRYFYSFIEFFVIRLKNQEVKI